MFRYNFIIYMLNLLNYQSLGMSSKQIVHHTTIIWRMDLLYFLNMEGTAHFNVRSIINEHDIIKLQLK